MMDNRNNSSKRRKSVPYATTFVIVLVVFLAWQMLQGIYETSYYFSSQHRGNTYRKNGGLSFGNKNHTETPSTHAQLSCFHPDIKRSLSSAYYRTDVPIPTPILNMGFPKMGSTTLHNFFQCANLTSSHWRCHGKETLCGKCMKKAYKRNLSPLQTCGNYEAYTQMDYAYPEHNNCFFPQVALIHEFHKESPNATFVLPFRNMEKWFDSLKEWVGMNQRIANCNIAGFPPSTGKKREEFEQFFCDQVNRVRSFVAQHPSHTLIEINIEDHETASIMGKLFNVNGDVCWGHYNMKTSLPKLNVTANTTTTHVIQ